MVHRQSPNRKRRQNKFDFNDLMKNIKMRYSIKQKIEYT